MVSGPNYLKFLTQELPEFITKMFPVSVKRENTFIAGLSMGGYGGFGRAGSLCGCREPVRRPGFS